MIAYYKITYKKIQPHFKTTDSFLSMQLQLHIRTRIELTKIAKYQLSFGTMQGNGHPRHPHTRNKETKDYTQFFAKM
jgi:hypothetical protein